MTRFTTLTALAAPFPQKNVDTDTIIRIERCTGTPKAELGKYAFEMARYLPDGSDNPDFVLNQPRYRGARILVCGEFFGTGSSREMAVWALAGLGMRCLIAPSFGEIFRGNCFQNGVLPIALPAAAVDALMRRAEAPGAAPFTVDLERQTVNGEYRFEVDARRKKMLLEGLDEIALTLCLEPRIAAYQAADRVRRPWIYDFTRS
ncbi:MAG TPA: 3-isopropylmalate dehydratase small subunit [Burkholderiales bacterium]|nr:3-isopropylmalate dehydratase small subunit [Burkholderiales bacterium]